MDLGGLPQLAHPLEARLGPQALAFKDLFCAMGWAPPRPSVPPLASASQLSKLLGNMLCPPVIGAILIGIFTAVQEKKTREGEKCRL